jgi:hypothetical protein
MRVLPTSFKSIVTKIAALILGSSMLVSPGMMVPAHADVTSATIRLINPAPVGGTNAVNETQYIYHGSGNIQANDSAYVIYHARGGTYSYTYQAKDQDGNPVANHAITLNVNPLYSGTTAHLSITASSGQTAENPGTAVVAAPVDSYGNGSMSTVSGTTDANGYVTFNITNTDTTGGDLAPTNIFDAPGYPDSGVVLKTNMYPTLGLDDANEAVDISWDHFTAPAAGGGGTNNSSSGSGGSLTSATIRLINPAPVGGTNAVNETQYIYHGSGNIQANDSAYVIYHARGGTYSYTYQAKDQDGNPVANHAITLNVNPLYSGTTAHLSITASSGQTAENPGTAVVAAPVDSYGNGSMSTVSGTTDANGYVTFNITNTDTTGGDLAPTNIFDAPGYPDSGVVLKTNMYPTLGLDDANEAVDISWDHFTAPAAGGGGDGGSDSGKHYNIKLTSPSLAEHSFDATSDFYRGDFTGPTGTANGASDHAYVYYATIGSTLTLTYHVDDGAIGETGAAVPGKTISLIVGKNYSNSKASFANAPANPGGYPSGSHETVLTGITDQNGNVTFTLVNTNTSGSNAPASETSDPKSVTGTIIKSNIYPTTGTGSSNAAAQNETIDNLWPYFYSSDAGSQNNSSGLPTSRFVGQDSRGFIGSYDDTSASSAWAQYYGDGLKYFHNYVYKGSTIKMTWYVTNSAGVASANTPVSLILNKGYSGSTAKWTTSTGTASPVGGPTSNGANGLVVSGQTDSSGYISFLFKDASTSAEPASTPTNAADPLGNSGVFGQVTLLINGVSQSNSSLDIIDIHVLTLPTLPTAAGATSTSAPQYVAPSSSTGATAIIDGVPTTTTVIPDVVSASVQVSVAGITVTANGTSDTGSTQPLGLDNSLQVPPTGVTNITAGGFQQGTMVDAYMHSTLIYLGRFPTDANGNLTAALQIPAALAAGGHTLQIVGLTASGATVSLAIPVTVVLTAAQVHAAEVAANNEAARLAWIAKQPVPVKAVSEARASISSDVKAKTVTCSAPSITGTATMAAYYLFVNHQLLSGKRFGSFVTNPLYPAIDATTGDADLNSATWTVPATWNAGHIATISCAVQIENATGSVVSYSSNAILPRVGKYVAVSKTVTSAPTAVTMRLIAPVFTKDESGNAVDFVDQSASPIQDHWSQYYGNANGGLGVFYKYYTAGSKMTFTYHVTDSKTRAVLPYYTVWLNVNKNYGGVEIATFTYEKNGITYQVEGHSTDLGETQIPGITDANGDVTFTLVNTNDPALAEPKPTALNKVQPASVTSQVFSTITLMAHLSSTSETKETKDFVWAHFVKP